jgi:type 1 glutamine amidotransferase
LTAGAAEPKKLLVVTTTTGFRHSSIATAEKVLTQLAEQSKAFTLDFAQQPPNKPNPPKKPANASDADLEKFKADEEKFKTADSEWQAALVKNLSKLSADNLKNYDGVIFANTTGDLPIPDPQAFVDWIAQGHAFIGMHSASDTYHGFSPYIEMLGGEFQTHGAQVGIECLVQDMKHPATRHFGESFCIEQEEVYIIKSYDPAKVHELLTLDKHPNHKSQSGHFAVAWVKEHGKGKVFYTTLGHREDVWENPKYQKHILGGIKWALGLEPGDAKPQARLDSAPANGQPVRQAAR